MKPSPNLQSWNGASRSSARLREAPAPNTLPTSSAERVPEEGLPGGGDAQHLQQQAVADLRTLAALQREHVLLRGGEGDLRPQAHELPGSLVSPPSLLPSLPRYFLTLYVKLGVTDSFLS